MKNIPLLLPLSILISACTLGQQPQAPVSSAPEDPVEITVDDDTQPEITPAEPEQTRPAQCPADKPAPEYLSGVNADHFSPDYWMKKDNRVIMNQEAIRRHNARFNEPMNDLDTPLEKSEIENNLRARLKSFKEKFENDEIVFEDGSKPPADDFERPLREFESAWKDYESGPKQYILVEDSTILCGPHDSPYIKPVGGEVRFSRNNCSLGRAQARIEVIFTQSDGMRFVRTRDMWGWLSPNAKLSPVLENDALKSDRDGRWFTTREMTLSGVKIPRGSFLAGTKNEVIIATTNGFEHLKASEIDGILDTNRPLTRNDWIQTLFLFVNDPYGWGGYGGFRDCSRLLLDTARSFNIRLPRNSKQQAVQTSYYLDVAGIAPEDKLQKIDEAAQTGIVFLYFPGHIMAYLGHDNSGTPIILHSFSEYYEACPDGIKMPENELPQSLVHVDRVTLSDLSLGKNTSRTTFLDRITHVAVLTDLSAKADDSGNKPWATTRDWTPAEETMFSAFVERLFDYPEEPDKTWTNLGDILRDPKHNILYNAFGQHEDDRLKLEPDCADLPYMLRTYYAWKRGLPMAVRKCGRGSNHSFPKCGSPIFHTNQNFSGNAAKRFNSYAVHVGAYQVQSGNVRTALDDDNTDFYPVELTRSSLRPGTTFADPHGHVLVIAHYTPDTADTPGSMLSVDAQPDGTITRKRFWRGNFLFDPAIQNVGAGFKAFRPIVNVHQLTNEELSKESGFIPYSTEQHDVSKEVFYDRVEAAIHPIPLAIPDAAAELTNALGESAERRVVSVQTGDDYVRENGISGIVMPKGYAVFETSGSWEDYATPSRDMRMLVAIDAVLDFPEKIRRNAARYGLTDEQSIQNAVDEAKKQINAALENKQITYQNSLGQPTVLTLKTITERADALEMGYHPADCNEIRWGAPENSDEIRSCSRRASDSERTKLLNMKTWFHQRTRPPR